MPKIKVNNINMYYEVHGAGEPLVLISGFSGDHNAWQTVIEDFAKFYQVLIFDNRGIGETECPNEPYTTEMMADDTAELIKALGFKKVHVIGHSFGGCIAQNIAYKYPDIVKSVVLVSSPDKLNIRAVLYSEIRLNMMLAKVDNETIAKFFTMVSWSKNYLSLPGKIDELVKQGAAPITLTGYKNQMHAATTFDSSSWLNKIQTPCYIIGSDDDAIIGTEQFQNMAKIIPNSKYYCLNNVGHVPQGEKPEEFKRLVLDFLKKHKEEYSYE